MATMRGPHVYNIRNGMDYHDVNDIQPIQLRLSPSESRLNNQDIQQQNLAYNNARDTPQKKSCSCCTKLCALGTCIGLTIGLIIAAAVVVPIAVVKFYAPLGTIFDTPNWVGTYQVDNACNTNTCCCLSTQFTVTEPGNNQITVSGGVTGVCNNLPSSIVLTQSIPAGFQLLVSWYGQVLRFQLGQDNSYISVVNMNYPYCSASALRTSYNHGSIKNINLGLIVFILLILIGIGMII